MMTQHTPGPWVASCCDITDERPVGEDGVRFWNITQGGVPYRGDVCNVHQAGHIGGITIAERDANARLISAAPDLLDVVQTLRDYVSDCASGWIDDGSNGSRFRDMAHDDLARIDAAIAKATAA